MKIISTTFSPSAASTTSLAALQTTGGAANLTLATSTFDYARQISLTSTGNISGVTFTITGLDADGAALVEAIAGPNNNTVYSTGYFKSVTTIAAGGAVGTNTSAGIKASMRSAKIVLNHSDEIAATHGIALVSGTATWTLSEAFDDVRNAATPYFIDLSAQSAKSASTAASGTPHATAVRLTITAFSSGVVKHNVVQSGSCD